MQFSAVSVLALVAAVSATYNGTVVYTTEVHTAYTTYCPEATTLTYGPSTYTVSAATTLTISSCPGGCTVVKPVTSYPAAPPTYSAPAPTYTAPTAYPTANSTVPAGPAPTGSYSASPPTSTAFTGGAHKAVAGPLAGLIGLAAYLL